MSQVKTKIIHGLVITWRVIMCHQKVPKPLWRPEDRVELQDCLNKLQFFFFTLSTFFNNLNINVKKKEQKISGFALMNRVRIVWCWICCKLLRGSFRGPGARVQSQDLYVKCISSISPKWTGAQWGPPTFLDTFKLCSLAQSQGWFIFVPLPG